MESLMYARDVECEEKCLNSKHLWKLCEKPFYVCQFEAPIRTVNRLQCSVQSVHPHAQN